MLSSAVRTFSDPYDYAANVRAAAVELTVIGRGAFRSKLTRIDLHRLWMQRFSENLPRIVDCGNLLPGRAFFSFGTRSGPSLRQGAVEIVPTAILRHGRADHYYQRASGAAELATMSLPLADMAALGETMAGADLMPPRDAVSVASPPAAMARLQRLHAAAATLAEVAPELIADPDAAHGLEQALIGALADCLRDRPEHETRLSQGHHAIVLARFRRMLDENPDQPIYIPEICKAIRVPERTLRVCCQEHLGMSPKRYLVLRRMNLARRALRLAGADATTVTEVATRFGFWQLGRFAVEYRALFGETPSATLHRRSE
jgi:AraC-like DNA-binding protein